MTLAILDARDTEYVVVAAGSDLIGSSVVQAQNAAAAAEIAAAAVGVFPTVAAGLTATVSGESFYVAEGGVVTLYTNTSGAAVEAAELASVASIAAVQAEVDAIQTDVNARSSDLVLTGYSKPVIGSTVIRQSTAGGGWSFLNDAGHTPGNFAGVITVSGGDIVVPYGYTASKVGQLTVTPDEAFAGLGVVAGASVGNATATISLYMPMHIYGNLTSMSTGTAGIATGTFFTGDVTAIKSGSSVTITHPSCGSASNTPALAPFFVESDIVAWDNRLTSYTATSVTVVTTVPFTFTVSFNGTSWVVATPMDVAPTVTSFSGNLLTIAFNRTLPLSMLHPQVSPGYDASGTIARTEIYAVATTQIQLVFKNISLAPIGTAAVGMKATVTLPVNVKAAAPMGRVGVVRPNTKADGDKVANGSANFWINSTQEMGA